MKTTPRLGMTAEERLTVMVTRKAAASGVAKKLVLPPVRCSPIAAPRTRAGKARASKLTAEQRSEQARRAAEQRWRKR